MTAVQARAQKPRKGRKVTRTTNRARSAVLGPVQTPGRGIPAEASPAPDEPQARRRPWTPPADGALITADCGCTGSVHATSRGPRGDTPSVSAVIATSCIGCGLARGVIGHYDGQRVRALGEAT